MKPLARDIAAAGAVVALALTGCTPSPSSAAVVDGVRIPDASARQAAGALVAATGGDGSRALRQATFDLTMGEASEIIAAQQNVSVTDAELQAVLTQSPTLAAIGQTDAGRGWANSVARTYVVLEALGQDDFTAALGDLDIEINPRYGTWDPARFTLVDSSLSRVAVADTER